MMLVRGRWFADSLRWREVDSNLRFRATASCVVARCRSVAYGERRRGSARSFLRDKPFHRAGRWTGLTGLRLGTLLGPLPGRVSDAGPARDRPGFYVACGVEKW